MKSLELNWAWDDILLYGMNVMCIKPEPILLFDTS